MIDLSANLSKRLLVLADSASRESVQTLAKWLAFHRPRAATSDSVSLADTIAEFTINPNTPLKRKWLYMNIVHEVLVMDSSITLGGGNVKKWERFKEFRSLLGRVVILPSIGAIRFSEDGKDSSESLERLKKMWKVWEELDSFSSSSLLEEIRESIWAEVDGYVICTPQGAEISNTENMTEKTKMEELQEEIPNYNMELITNPGDERMPQNETPTETTAMPIDSEQEPPQRLMTPIPENDDEDMFLAESPPSSPSRTNEASEVTVENNSSTPTKVPQVEEKETVVSQPFSPSADETPTDFESETQGVPYEKVNLRDLIAPCKAIATMQISRELRHEMTIHLSSLLATIPKVIEEACQSVLDNKSKHSSNDGANGDTNSSKVDLDNLPSLSDDILDLDVDDALSNVRLYRDIVEKQREARRTCLDLLVKSRCEFGSIEAAEAYYSLAGKMDALRKRKVMLSDEMELEGLDLMDEEQEGEMVDDEENLEDFVWHPPGGGIGSAHVFERSPERSAKKAKQ